MYLDPKEDMGSLQHSERLRSWGHRGLLLRAPPHSALHSCPRGWGLHTGTQGLTRDAHTCCPPGLTAAPACSAQAALSRCFPFLPEIRRGQSGDTNHKLNHVKVQPQS